MTRSCGARKLLLARQQEVNFLGPGSTYLQNGARLFVAFSWARQQVTIKQPTRAPDQMATALPSGRIGRGDHESLGSGPGYTGAKRGPPREKQSAP